MIALESEKILSTLIDDLRCDFFLASHSIDRNNATFDFQNCQQFRNGRDLVGFVVHLHLAKHSTAVGCLGADHVNRGLIRRFIERATKAPAVNCNDLYPRLKIYKLARLTD